MNLFIEPNIHPILVHFAYALSITSVFCYWLSGLRLSDKRRHSLLSAADWMLAFAALAIVATIAAGFQAYYSVAHDTPSHAAMTTHRNWAVPSGLAILGLAFWRWTKKHKRPTGLFKGLFVLAAISLSITAWWGGHIVYNYGLGVKSLPVITGDGHDHDHGDAAPSEMSQPLSHDDTAPVNTHDDSDGHHSPGEALLPKADVLGGSPEALVNAFGAALRSGDEATLRSIIAPDVVITEGGRAERSFDQYAGHHMRSDMAFIGAIETTLIKRDSIIGSEIATIVSESRLHGSFNDQTINSQIMETMVLRHSEQGWRITHIHWSSAPIKEEHGH